MMIKKANFITSAASIEGWPEHPYPELLILGRSNVGKSTFINSITNQKQLAKTSNTPGKTRLINFFDINNHQFVLVDAPGYGFARISRQEQAQFSKLMDDYLLKRSNLKGALLLLDLRHPPTIHDQQIYNFLKTISKPVLVVGTKLDKLKKNDYQKQEKLLKETIKFEPTDDFIKISSLKKTNLDQIYGRLIKLIERS